MNKSLVAIAFVTGIALGYIFGSHISGVSNERIDSLITSLEKVVDVYDKKGQGWYDEEADADSEAETEIMVKISPDVWKDKIAVCKHATVDGDFIWLPVGHVVEDKDGKEGVVCADGSIYFSTKGEDDSEEKEVPTKILYVF